MRKFFQIDWVIFLPSIFLLTMGFVSIISTSPELTIQVLFYIFLGIIIFLMVKEIDYRVYKPFSLALLILGISFIVITYLAGEATRGAVRWINLGSFQLQPSELIKPILIIFSAAIFSENKPISGKTILKFLFAVSIPTFLVFKQPDLGNTIVYLFLFGSILLATGLKRFILIAGGVLIGGAIPLVWRFLKEYQRQRILTFLNPGQDPLGAGYNAIQAEIAVGSGQLLGRGIGRGTQSHLKFLPEFRTDFVFATISEELGFVGSVIIILAFGTLLLRIIDCGEKSQDHFAYLICIGAFAQILIQVFINIGMNIGLVPITGITLPLVSYGGSSLVATMATLGIIANIQKAKSRKGDLHIG